MALGAPAWRWISPGQRVNASGYDISSGLFYLGRRLRSPDGEIEPALIDPELPVTVPAVTVPAVTVPAYHLISPATRTAYLQWLARDRRGPVPAGLVLLFCGGLERRVLVDGGDDRAVRDELPVIAAEVRRLRARYGEADEPALREAFNRLLDLLELLGAPRLVRHATAFTPAAPASGAPASGASASGQPSLAEEKEPPIGVRMALAGFAATATPVPAEWARAWVRWHPSLTARPAQLRCPAEFDRLFALRYRGRHGAGLIPPDGGPGIRLRYRPVNPGLAVTLVCREDLPDVLGEPRIARTLGWLVDAVTGALDPYSRWLARFPEGHGSLAAASLLPAELLDTDHGRLGALRIWTEGRLGDRPLAVIDAAALFDFWATASRQRMTRDEAAALGEVLALVGVGVEPDVRFGVLPLAEGPAVLFRLAPERLALGRYAQRDRSAPTSGGVVATDPAPRFLVAAAIVRCVAAAVTAATGPVDPNGRLGTTVLAVAGELAADLQLAPTLRHRLVCRLAWLLVTGVSPDRLARQVASLDADARDLAGRYLVPAAAAADPALGPATVTVLARIYRILGLDRGLLFSRLHECGIAGPRQAARRPPAARPGGRGRSDQPGRPGPQNHPAGDDPTGHERDEPVVVCSGRPVTDGYALPWATTLATAGPRTAGPHTAGPHTAGSGAVGPGTDQGGGQELSPDDVRLDPGSISQKLAESEAVSTLLNAIFDAEGDVGGDAEGTDPAADEPAPVAVEARHSRDDNAESVVGLDPSHSRLLRVLATRPSWSFAEFVMLADAQGVLPGGALDLLNEAAIDATGDPVVEGTDTLVVDLDVLRELLA